jgi:hypothetical protein
MDGIRHREWEGGNGQRATSLPRSQTTSLRGNERIVIMRVAPIQQNSRREILRAKSLGPASTVKVEAAGDGSTTLTGADGPYNDEAFRAKAILFGTTPANNPA